MRYTVIVIIGMITVFAGCVTMPDPVDEKFLVNMTRDEAKNIDSLEKSIIVQNKKKNTSKEIYEAAERDIKVQEGRLSILESEKDLLIKKEKQYLIEDDESKIQENKNLISQKDAEILRQKDRLDYARALRDDRKVLYEIEEAQLAILVSELNYIKARIARDYQDAMIKQYSSNDQKESPGIFKPEELVVLEKYKDYHEKQKVILRSKVDMQKKTEERLQQMKEKLGES